MNALEPDHSHTSSDRRVLGAIVAVSLLLTIIVFSGVAELLDRSGGYDVAIAWTEIIAGVLALIAVLRAGPLALTEMAEPPEASGECDRSPAPGRTAVPHDRHVTKRHDLFRRQCRASLHGRAASSGVRRCAVRVNNSRDRLDLSIAWDWPDSEPPETISPSHCWALKQGKPHTNLTRTHALCCEHPTPGRTTIEFPMMARGEVYGLLQVLRDDADSEAEVQLTEVEPLASAIADAMSLALSNIALREKLRTQALRDPLTGLYNRRYMEDALERFAGLAERNGTAVSAIMIDLDHFKRLNDEHGHARGDAVLREVATAIVGALRPSDVACRYGGEDLAVILPECPLAEALAKAEVFRTRIEALSEIHDTRITASLGVATLRETAAKASEILASADAAL